MERLTDFFNVKKWHLELKLSALLRKHKVNVKKTLNVAFSAIRQVHQASILLSFRLVMKSGASYFSPIHNKKGKPSASHQPVLWGWSGRCGRWSLEYTKLNRNYSDESYLVIRF